MNAQIMRDILSLSSRTMATLTGEKETPVIDQITADWIEFVDQQKTEYAAWREAWEDFNRVRLEKKARHRIGGRIQYTGIVLTEFLEIPESFIPVDAVNRHTKGVWLYYHPTAYRLVKIEELGIFRLVDYKTPENEVTR